MGKSGKFIRTWRNLPASGKLDFLKAASCLVFIKAGLKLLPFSSFRKFYNWLITTNAVKERSQQEIDQVVWAVDTAANLLPFELLCLPRALAAKLLLRNVASLTLEIGIEVNPAKPFEAHAWVEKNGRIIIGHWPATISYHRLWVWE